ncbi:MAG: beta-galactosidase [Patescibacteria group bacterium]
MPTPIKKILKYIIISIVAALAVLIAVYRSMDRNINADLEAGVTFSRPYAEDLGLDADETLAATLDDLQVKNFRIPAYWNLLQPAKDTWNWEWLDRDLDAIAERGGKVTLAVGHKLPRWPECWTPTWARYYDKIELEQAVKDYLSAVVERYKTHPAVISYQVENEPNFPFGICPEIDKKFIDEEIAFVRDLDETKNIATTDSGELTFWSLGGKVDKLGVSVYRVVVSPLGILKYWFIPPQFYLRKGQLTKMLYNTQEIYISEFQMEPWVKTTIPEASLDEQMKTFNLMQMEDNIQYAKRMGIKRIDFWGVEWWYWMKKTQNDSRYWNLAKELFPN